MTVTKHSNDAIQSNPSLVLTNDKIDVVSENLKQEQYIFSIKAYSIGSESEGYVDMTFSYEVERSILMVLFTVVYFLIFFMLIIDAVVHSNYKLMKYFIYSSQLMHLIGLCNVESPPASYYFVYDVAMTSFTNVWFTRLMMKDAIETQQTYFFNGALETRHSLFLLPFTIFLILLVVLCI